MSLSSVKFINFIEQSQRKAQLTVAAFPLVILDCICSSTPQNYCVEERRKQPLPRMTGIDNNDFYLLEGHFQQLSRVKNHLLVSILSSFDVRLAGITIEGYSQVS